MDHLDEVLSNASIDLDMTTAIRVAFDIGKKTLNRYYTLTDNTWVYRLAMSKPT
jgi:hypothetical protein